MPKWTQVDCREMGWARAKRHLCHIRLEAGKGDVIEIISTLETLQKRLGVWCKRMGGNLVRTERVGESYVTEIEVLDSITRCR